MKFTKMHGCGNDFIIIEAGKKVAENREELARTLCDRNHGIGANGLILVGESDVADFGMLMYNADGTLGDLCGDGIRCLGKYVYDNGLINKSTMKIETSSGVKKVSLNLEKAEIDKSGKDAKGKTKGGKISKVGKNAKDDGEPGLPRVTSVKVEMGEPEFLAARVPVIFPKDKFINEPLEIGGKIYRATCLSIGNPHCVVPVEKDLDKLNLEDLGPKFENHVSFPRHVNTEFVTVVDRTHIWMRVWERGIGETLSCGTGACAAVAAAVVNGSCDEKVVVELPGGSLKVYFNREKNQITLTGPAETIFVGKVELDTDKLIESDVKIYRMP